MICYGSPWVGDELTKNPILFFHPSWRSINSTNLELFTSKAEKIGCKILGKAKWQSSETAPYRRLSQIAALHPPNSTSSRCAQIFWKNLGCLPEPIGFPIPFLLLFQGNSLDSWRFFVDFLCCSIVVSSTLWEGILGFQLLGIVPTWNQFTWRKVTQKHTDSIFWVLPKHKWKMRINRVPYFKDE